ncbi:MAG: hypothetical protein A2293_00245 [Elusimicrobia bacterium RIFOXYB2_FULL_49_7]|nr:MAG: hypothetical protein A2293_00245 [Elusimicrobia bacterium RIFOXYB2_FULL_49_7]
MADSYAPLTTSELSSLFITLMRSGTRFQVYYGSCPDNTRSVTISLKNFVGQPYLNKINASLTVPCTTPLQWIVKTIRETGRYSVRPFASFPDTLPIGELFTHYGLFRSDAFYTLQVVLANGELLHLGSQACASVTGYQAISLFLGTKNLIGVPVEYTLRLLPLEREENMPVFSAESLKSKNSDDEERRLLLAMKNRYDPTHLLNTTAV